MSNKQSPKVLIISGEPFNSKSATGITLSNLFCGWPKNKILQIYSAGIAPDNNICENNIRISNKDLLFVRVLYQFRQKIPLKSLAAAFTPHASTSEPEKKKNLKSGFLRNVLISWLDLLPYKLSGDILSQIKEYKPDVIYSPLGNIRLVRLVTSVSASFSTPVVAHFMDDWLSTYSSVGGSFITIFQRTYINRLTHKLLSKSSLGLAISDVMAEEYSKRFGVSFLAFMNPVALPHVNRQQAVLPKETVTFIYVGGFHLRRYENLIDIAKVIAKIRGEGINVRLLIYAPLADIKQHGEAILNDGVEICGTIASHEMQGVLSEADVAVHVESFREKFIRYTRLSLSTKLPQYCAAALPILAYGPHQIASCRYVHDNECGITIGYKEMAELEKVIRKLTIDVTFRRKLATKSLVLAHERHEEKNVREHIRAVLATVAQKWRVA